MQASPRLILLVEDEPISRVQLAQFLTEEGYLVIPVASGKEALRLLETESFEAVIADFKLNDSVSGIDVLRRFESLTPGQCKILITGYSPDQMGKKPAGTFYIWKPIKLDELLLMLKSKVAP